MKEGMARQKQPKPIIEQRVVEVRVGWEHPACAWCGKSFVAKRVDAKTCSDICRAKASARARAQAAA